ncbi:hypothetical protein SAMN06295974_3792 [Plantibacter flavus]|uniref:Uncharacterized protein n=1 Tax=Plantibacter flavus TaxID=150123 RepID=A0A3N2BLB8_9MICO|nr:hypothetical protein [Plantibacter flavus]ROR76060.1 hypothetical protein EDD42_4013 [Plantibacter flavus]SMG48947.1 hypothetical protein SAMN06295974_3792 [Plantibacter flavus]
MPRKSNRQAAKFLAAGGRLWDHRRVERKARKLALDRADAAAQHPRRQHLAKRVRVQMLETMTGWSFEPRTRAFVATDRQTERLEELISAAIQLGDEPVVLRVSGLSFQEAARVRGYLNRDSRLLVVQPRTDGPAFV